MPMSISKPNVSVRHATMWVRALNFARETAGKAPKEESYEPSDAWKAQILLAEHSPIRTKEYDIHFEKIRQWVTVHLVRHWLGFIPFVHSQREDRRELDVPRDELPQGSLNDMEVAVNAQSLINVSRKRLCAQASTETRAAWSEVKKKVAEIDPIMAGAMVPECIYRGFCPERRTCGYYKTEAFKQALEEYRKPSTKYHD